MDLAEKEAEQLAREYFLQSGKHREFLEVHCKAVYEAVQILAEGKSLDEETLKIAAWVHDIGYVRGQKSHAEHSLNMLEERGYEISDTLKDCILNHGTDKQPETEEGKIFRIADKAAVYDQDTLKVFLIYPKEALKLLETLQDGALELLKQYKAR